MTYDEGIGRGKHMGRVIVGGGGGAAGQKNEQRLRGPGPPTRWDKLAVHRVAGEVGCGGKCGYARQQECRTAMYP